MKAVGSVNGRDIESLTRKVEITGSVATIVFAKMK